MRTPVFPGWWQVVVAMLIQAASTAAVFTAFSVVAVAIQGEFGSSQTLIVLAITMTVLMAGIVNPFIGTALDRHSIRTLLLLGAALLVAGFFCLSVTTSTLHVVIIYGALMAPAVVLLGPIAASTLLARWFNRRRGMVMGIAASGTALGGLALPPLLQGLIGAFEWRTGLQIFSAVLFVVTVPAILLLAIDRPEERGLHPDGESTPPPETTAQRDVGHFNSTAAVLRDPNFWFIATILGLVFAGLTALMSNLLPLVLDRGITAEQGALLLSILSAGNFGGKLLFASVADRIDLRLALAAALVLVLISIFGFQQADSFKFFGVASLVLGLSAGGFLPLWGFLTARAFGPANVGRVMGLMTTVVTAFNLSSPLVFALVFDKTGSYNFALIGYMGLLLIALALLPRIRTDAVAMPAKAAVG